MVKQSAVGAIARAPEGTRSQFGALCWRIKQGKLRILLVTSRRSGRWIIPKGWPMAGRKPHEAARQEAWEEAGAVGRVSDRCLGFFTYDKAEARGTSTPCAVMVYGLEVKSLAAAFPEHRERRRKWMSRKKAAAAVSEPELARLLREFDPRKRRKKERRGNLST